MFSKKTRHRIQELEIQRTFKHATVAEIHVDTMEAVRLPSIGPGMPIRWQNIGPCETLSGSRIKVILFEKHFFGSWKSSVGSVEYVVSSVQNRRQLILLSDTHAFKAMFTFPDSNPVIQCDDRNFDDAAEALLKARLMERPQRLVDRLGFVKDVVSMILDTGGMVADIHPIAKAAYVICNTAWEKLKKQEQCDEEVNRLIEELSSILPYMKIVHDIATLLQLKSCVLDLLHLIEDASQFIIGYNLDGGVVHNLKKLVGSTAKEQVNSLMESLKKLEKEFDRGVNLQALQMMDMKMRMALGALKPVGQAQYNITRSCMPGTREKIIQDILKWCLHAAEGDVTEPTSRLLWVHGDAGFGKTAISTSVCESLDKEERLAASFFCRRDDPECRDPRRVMASIIYELAIKHRPYGQLVIAQLAEKGALNTSMQKQYERLVQDLLGSPALASSANRFVVLVDALDECNRDMRRQLIGYLLKMSQLVTWLRIIVTSRPKRDIKKVFENSKSIPFSALDVFQYHASEDIRTFIRGHFADSTDSEPLSEEMIDRLTMQSNGLFLWAKTACRHVLDGPRPQDRLKSVLALGSHSSATYKEPDSIYKSVLKTSMANGGKGDEDLFKECLDAIIVSSTRMPLSVTSLCALLGQRFQPETMQSVVNSLNAVIQTDDTKEMAVRVLHPSFVDYMTTPRRSRRFHVNIEEENAQFAICCMRILKKQLRFNICGLATCYKRNQEVENFDERVNQTISRELRYSCLFWTSHLADCQGGDEGLVNDILTGPTVLYWIEALSLMGKLDTALACLRDLKGRYSEKPLYSYVNDLDRFIRTFYDPISESTPHLYTSALGFLPANSMIHTLRNKYFPNTIKFRDGMQHNWPLWLHCVSHDDAVQSIAVSHNGRRVASGLAGGKICIWDSDTATATAIPFAGHTGAINSVAFSPDDCHIVSGSADKTLRLWNVEASEVAGNPFMGHSEAVRCVTFSPNGGLIASGSDDHTIRLWNTATGNPVRQPFAGHSGRVFSVAFAPNGIHIVSGSQDRTLMVWDVNTGAHLWSGILGHFGPVMSVAFSPDGQLMVSGSSDNTLKLWSVATREELKTLVGHTKTVTSVAFSHDGRRIISGSFDKTLRVWSIEDNLGSSAALTGHSEAVFAVAAFPDGKFVSGSKDRSVRIWEANTDLPLSNDLHGHTKGVYAVTFSPNGRHIASASGDKTIQQWDMHTGAKYNERFREHSRDICAIEFSPDGGRIASGSSDTTIIIHDAKYGTKVLPPLIGHTDTVSSLSFSSDGRRLASGSWDRTVRIWDTATGSAVGPALSGHTDFVASVAFSNDGRYVVSGSWDKTVRMWDVRSGALRFDPITKHEGLVLSVALSSDDSRIISGSWDKTVRVWDAQTGESLSDPLEGHSDGVMSVLFSRDDRYIISGSWDKTIRIWDASTFAAAGKPLMGHSWPVRSVALSHDGQHIVSGSDDYTVRVWSLATGIETRGLQSEYSCEVEIVDLETTPNEEVASQTDSLNRSYSQDLPSNAFRLTEGRDPTSGWVTTSQGELLFWLPPEYRGEQPDDSKLVISSYRLPPPVWLDYSNFVHGDRWTDVFNPNS